MMELLGAFSSTILGFILCIAGILYMRKAQKKKPLPHILWYPAWTRISCPISSFRILGCLNGDA
ncbi:hypothetical protein [Paenisporosarcina sp. OV554]|uniref:hypothetical protein n=1 Tax=Paenisporosarcina sp. OV554 TaxID=2135694 RepID=UPI000D49DE0A|nr:hypothetical protein [Paenisporosarcina sp. OV554]PUB13853.1 hypothetical protein C8K15_1064 [Paenisporosarcina sp. OV554]